MTQGGDPLPLFDIHAHMACEPLCDDLEGVVARMRTNAVAGCMVVCDPGDPVPDHERAIEILRRYPEFRLAAACHPQNALHYTQETEAILRRIAALPFCRCIGETGLDYYDNQTPKPVQISVLERHLDLALETDLPVQLHVRNAHGDMLEILARRKKEKRLPRCIVHCFTRSAELARAYLRLGAYISFGGPVTYANANKLLDTVKQLPADRILIETDSPWVAPEPRRGAANEPANLIHIFRQIARLRGEDADVLAALLWKNTKDAGLL